VKTRLSFLAIICALGVNPVRSEIMSGGVPLQLSLGVSAGASQSHIESDELLKSYFEPTTTIQRPIAPAAGLDCEMRIGKFAAVSLGMKYEYRGENTGLTTVKFNDDIFDHTLQTTAGFHYVSTPLVFKGGYCGKSAWVFVRAGLNMSLLLGDTLSWVIDGRPATPGSDRMPSLSISQYDFAGLVGCEAGLRFHHHGVFFTVDYLHGFRNLSYTLNGWATNVAYEGCVGYRYFF
jgi:hypothetical protein